jgi:hypothetical protein
MKHVIVIVLFCFCQLTHAQFSFGIKAGVSPDVRPGTTHCIINRDKPAEEFLFNAEVVKFSSTLGIFARLDNPPYWFSAEFLTYGWKERFSIRYTQAYQERSGIDQVLEERKRVLEMPLSAGVSLGIVEIFSGFSFLGTLHETSELDQIPGFASSAGKFKAGWHGGFGINLNRISFDLRYTQFFQNYGQNRSVNTWDLTLDNARSKVLGTIALRL